MFNMFFGSYFGYTFYSLIAYLGKDARRGIGSDFWLLDNRCSELKTKDGQNIISGGDPALVLGRIPDI